MHGRARRLLKMASGVQLDIVHGKIVPYVPKPKPLSGTEPKAAKAGTTLKSARAPAAAAARADDDASSDSDPPPPTRPPSRRANAAITAEVLHAHFAEARLCYEAPTPADRSGQHAAGTWQVALCRPWQLAGTDLGQGAGATSEDMPGQEQIVMIRNGRADSGSPCVLDLRQASPAQLFALSQASGAERAFDGCLLRRALPPCMYTWIAGMHRHQPRSR